MHKKISAELTSLAHSILQMKNKDDVFTLKQKAYKVYEKLTVLAYVEEYIKNTPQATETKEELIAKIEAVSLNQKNESILAKNNVNKENFNTRTNAILATTIQDESTNIIDSNAGSDNIKESNTITETINTVTEIENNTITNDTKDITTTETKLTEAISNNATSTKVENNTIINNIKETTTVETKPTEAIINNTTSTEVENNTITNNTKEITTAETKPTEIIDNNTISTEVENNTITNYTKDITPVETKLTETIDNNTTSTEVENNTKTENTDILSNPEKSNDIQKKLSNLLENDIANIENAKINTENYFSETYKTATENSKESIPNKTEEQTVLFNDTNIQEEPEENNNQRKTITLEEELQGTLGVDVMANLFEKAEPPKTLNDLLQKTIHIGLNDRIAFVKHLFNGNQTDYNRVISQLNTIESEKEAKSFIKKIVKPEYNWSEKEEYETRLIEIIERKFS